MGYLDLEKKTVETTDRKVELAILKLRLLDHQQINVIIPISTHDLWLKHNDAYRAACVKTLQNDPKAPYPQWPVYYKGATWMPSRSITEITINGSALSAAVKAPIPEA